MVRPEASVTPFERRRRLVRDTYLDDLFGGVSDRQLAAIRSIPGIRAAPVENLGYVLASETVRFPFRPPTSGPAEQLFRLSARFSWPGGSEGWGAVYVYVERRVPFLAPTPADVEQPIPNKVAPRGHVGRDRSRRRRMLEVCGPQSQAPNQASLLASPFTAGHLDGHIACYSEVSPASGSFPGGSVVVAVSFDFPLLLTAIDPKLESDWFGLRRAIVSGRYLSEGAASRTVSGTSLGTVESVPVLASSTTQLDERLSLVTERVASSGDGGGRSGIARVLAEPDATRLVARLAARSTGPDTVVVERAQSLYQSLLRAAQATGEHSTLIPVAQYWVPRAPTLSASGRDAVRVPSVSEPAAVWRAPLGWGSGQSFSTGSEVQYVSAPPANGVTGYRALSVHDWAGRSSPVVVLHVVGQFDERRLTRFAALSRVPLGTFAAPVPSAVGASGAAALGGGTMRPTTDLGAYLTAPPELLTTLPAAEALLGPDRYRGTSRAAPIGAVLVRLDGRVGTGAQARTRLAAVAAAIRRTTGLAVDVTDGSSPTPVDVTLLPPARSTKRSGITVRDDWTKLGVNEALGSSVDAATSALLCLSALAGLLFGATTVSALVAARRRDFAVLAAAGWRPLDLARATIAEVAVLAAIASVAGAGVATLAALQLSLHVAALQLLLVAACGPVIATAGTVLPVWTAATSTQSGGGGGRSGRVGAGSGAPLRRRGRRRHATRIGLALATAATPRSRLVLAAAPFGLGVASTSLLVALQRTFSHQLLATRTLLGTALDLQSGPLQLASASVLAAMGVAAIVNAALSRQEDRQHTRAVLGALGWPDADLRVLAVLEGALITVIGAVGGGLVAVAAVPTLRLSLPAALLTSAIVSATGFIAVLLAILGPALASRARHGPAAVTSSSAAS